VGQVHLRNLLAFFFLGLGLWSIVERSAQQTQSPALVLLPFLSVLGLIQLLGLLHSGQGILAGTVWLQAGLMAGVLIVALVWPARVSAAAVLPFVSIFVVALMTAAHFYLGVNPWTLIFLCAPFVILWIRAWLPFIPRSPVPEAIGLGILGAIPLAYVLL
jgi:hypothetical protein